MAQDWSADVKKYAPDADDGIISGIVRHCGIALHKVDSSLVSMSDPAETTRVREGFLKKKLALTHPDSELDAAIKAVGERMKDDRTKNRVTVYYLLAEAFGKLEMFRKAPATAKSKSSGGVDESLAAAGLGAAAIASAAAAAEPSLLVQKGSARAPDPVAPPPPGNDSGLGAAAAAAGAAVVGLGVSGVGATRSVAEAIASPVQADPLAPAAPFEAGAGRRDRFITTPAEEEVVEAERGSMGWLPWLLLGLGILALLWFFLIHRPHERTEDAVPATTAAVTAPATMSTENVAAPAAAPAAAAPLTIPTGAGVTSETRDGKPAVNVYFDTGKTAIAPAFAAAAGSLKTYLDGNAGAKLSVSGFNDKTGNAAANAELSKNRAKAVQAALVAAGIPAAAVELTKPADTTDAAATSNEAARRVEVTIK